MAEENPNKTLRATCFPTGVAMGATWNTELVHRVGIALGKETRARGCSILLGPCVNIHRSPLGGRNFESFSEDPCLSSELAAGETRTLTFILDEESCSFFDPKAGKWVTEPGKFEIQIGSTSRDIRSRAFFTLLEK